MLIRGTNLHMIRGDSESLTIKIEESDGTPYEFQEGDIVYFTIKLRASAKEKMLQKIVKFFPDNQAIIEIEPKDTKGLGFRSYIYDIQLTRANGKVTTVIPSSKFEVLEEVTYE